MRNDWTYPVEIRRERDGAYHGYASALPEAIAAGRTEEEALEEMRQALVAAVRGRINDGMELAPPPGLGRREERHRVALPSRLAAKAAVYRAWKDAKVSKAELARRIGRNETEVRRILDPDHGTKLDQLEEAAKALGGRLSVTFEPA
jgi:antitoxin HicB